MWAIIGGSGFEKFENFKAQEEMPRETPYGLASKGFKKVSLEGLETCFIPRHGDDHSLLPSEVNYRANIYALKKAGVTKLLTFSAVGSLQNEYAPGDLVIPNQFIDRTKGVRKTSFCGEGLVGHVSLAEPISRVLKQQAQALLKNQSLDYQVHMDKTLVVMEGPQFSTKAESQLYRSWGADIIGMTSYPEYALAREAGLAYLNCCFVTDYDCWKDDIPHVTVEQVVKVMGQNNRKAYEIARNFIHSASPELAGLDESDQGLKSAFMSDPNQLTAEQREIMAVLAP